MQSPLAFRLGDLGASPLVAGLIVGTLDMGSKPFGPQGESGSGSSLLTVRHCARGGAHGESVSQPLWVFSQLPDV